MNVERLVEGYVKLRDKKSEIERKHKEELSPIKTLMADIEAKMLADMHTMATTSLKTASGTAYQTTRVSATVADRGVFQDYCMTQDMWECADIRASKTAIRAMLEDGCDLPPGINWREDIGVNFKR